MESKKNLFGLITGIFLAPMIILGCATQETSSTASPEKVYESYRSLSMEGGTLEELASYWDQEARDMFFRTADSSGNYIPIESFESSLRYPSLFAEAPSTPDAVDASSDSSCLLLAGPASDGGTLALSVKLGKEDGEWKHRELFAVYVDPSDSPPARPSCEAPEPFQN